MASYDAQINLLISGQRELERLSGRLRSIEKQIIDINRLGVSPQQRDPITGRFGADPDRQNRVRLAGIQRIGKEEERRARFTSARLRSQNSELERSILLQSRLNSAVDLYTTNLDKLSRGGGGARLGESLQGQIRDIKAAYDAATAGGTKNLSIVRSLGTELGRIVERQNEINRLSSFQSKAFYDTQRFERRMAELRTVGAPASAFGGVGRQIRELRSAQARGSQFEASDLTRRIKESLDRIARELEATTRQVRIENTARIAARSWEEFFKEANINTRRLEQNQKDATNKFRNFFEDAANQALKIGQNAKDTKRAWQNFFEDAQKEADRLRGERLSRFARLRGRPEQYGTEAGPLPSGGPGSPRYFKEAQQLAGQLLDVENEIGKIRQESLSESLRLETERLSLAEKRRQKEGQIRDVLLEAVTFGRGSQVKRAASDIATGGRNALVRGGLGLGALGIGGAYTSVQESLQGVDLGPLTGPTQFVAERLGGAINSALGGIPEIVNQMLSALGSVPSSLGLATVAALAFGPAMKTAGDAVFLAGKKFGESKFGENIKLTLDRQTNLFESVINKASEMNMVLDASRSGLDAVGRKIETLPALPAAGQTAFQGEIRRGRGGAFMGGGAREITNPEFLATAAGTMAQRTQEAARTSLMFAEGLGQAANEAKTIADYLRQANELRAQGESSAQRFVRQAVERGRALQQNQASAELARQRSAFLIGGQYSLAQVPARGELLPGGRTETRQPDYREMLNNAARVTQLQQEILGSMSKQQGFAATIGQIERRTVNDKGKSLQIQQEENAELQRSIQIIRERNKELRQRPIAAMTPQERVAGGILDPASLAASRRQRVERGRARQESIRRAASEGLIGGAFPLLFGQGIGAAAGGGLGGALGGFAGGSLGFGLSLVGTAFGTVFDQLNQAAQETGRALRYPVEGFEKLKEAGLLAGRQQEYYISKLIEAGRATEAAGLIQAEIIKKIGTQGVSDLRELGDSSTKLSRAWAEFNLQLQAALAGPMAGLLKWLAGVIEAGNSVGREAARQTDILAGLSSADRQKLLAEQSKLLGQSNFFNEPQINKQISELYTRFAPRARQGIVGGELTPEQQEQSLNKSIEVAEKVRALRQQGIDVERSAQDLRLSIEDTVYGLRRRASDMEREAIEFRRSVEDQVFSKRQELEQKLIENDRKRQQNAIDAFDLQLQKASTGLDPIAQGVADAAREYLRVRAEGEADLQQNEKQLKLQLQQIDQEVNRYKLQVEDRVSQMTIQREEFVRDVSRAKLQVERQIGDYAIKVEEYRLAMARRRYDLAVEEGNLFKATEIAKTEGLGVPSTGRNYANIGGVTGGRQMLHGIPGFTGYDPSHASETNIHYHFAGKDPTETKAVAEYLKGLGIQITEFSGFGQRVGRHSPGSQHYRGNAFDIPGASMEGRGGMADIVAGQKRVHALILDFLGARQQRPSGASAAPSGTGAALVAPNAPSMPNLPSAPQMVGVNDLMSQYLDLQVQIKGALQANNQQEVKRLALQAESARLAFEQQTLAPLRQYQEQNRELQFEIEKRQLRNRLLAEGVKPEIVEGELRALEINRTLGSVLEGYDKTAANLVNTELKRAGITSGLVDSTFSLTEATLASVIATTQDIDKQEDLRKKLQDILDLKNKAAGEAGTAIGGARAIAAQEALPGQKTQEFIAQGITELNDLESLALRVSQSIGDAVGNSIASGITGLIEGTTSAKEVFAGFLKDVGQILLQESTKLIATYIAIGIAKMFAFGPSGGTDKPPLPGSFPLMAANGAYFDGGAAYFANGGMFTNSVVSSPTLFQFADGGAMRTGVMGEAGPEAIMPLRRGPDGRLGVEASVFEAPRRAMEAADAYDSSSSSAASTMAASEPSGATSLGAGGSITIQTQVINNVEYATVDQVREASEASARKARSQVFADLKNRPASRQSVGIR